MLGAGSGAVVTGKTELQRHLEPSFLNCCLVLLCLPTFLAHENNKASCMFCAHTHTTHTPEEQLHRDGGSRMLSKVRDCRRLRAARRHRRVSDLPRQHLDLIFYFFLQK